ncbi:protein wingless-like [Pollicipes pollicipes]|nr:protein wingless-like [Pollicipes pollicipes]
MRGGYPGSLYPLNPFSSLRKKQRRLARENQGVIKAVASGTRQAVAECQHQFRDRRWNCPTQERMRGRRLFGRIVNTACRETAFLYAITSAAVTHAVSRSCSEGSVRSCACGYHHRQASGRDWQWGGCSDNIQFGYRFSRRFVDASERGMDMRYMMNIHNNEAGRRAVSSEMVRQCKCHGMSGSCAVKTCWMRLPSLRQVGDHLKGEFDGATRVRVSNAVQSVRRSRRRQRYNFQLQPLKQHHKPPTQSDLVYYEDSPNFCQKNQRLGFPGTVGRLCNDTSSGLDGCELMCCGRGYHTEIKEVLEHCECTFKWCCDVKCKVCRTKKVEHRCL